MRDVTGKEQSNMIEATDRFRKYAKNLGYDMIETPLLEETELFVRKSGGEITSSLYTFFDPGGQRVSLRPEFTSSIIRHLVQEWELVSLPVRWQYSGPVFRHKANDPFEISQFTQVGAELIGSSGVEADAEILSLAWKGLENLGLEKFRMRIGHLGALHSILDDLGLSEKAKLFVIGSVPELKNGSINTDGLIKHAEQLGLIQPELTSKTPKEKTNEVTLDTNESRAFIKKVLTGAMVGPMGRRTKDEIIGRLFNKALNTDTVKKLTYAINLISELIQIEGTPQDTFKQAKATLLAHGVKTISLNELEKLLANPAMQILDDSRVVMDLGLVRGISYYTGIVFELVQSNTEVILGGGGRYDGLVKALGGKNIEAIGFAYNFEYVMGTLRKEP